MHHLLVTNDFPPKLGGIQSYLWELWRRLPPANATVLTTPYRGAERFDAGQAFRVVRTREPVLLPTPGLAGRIRRLADEVGAGLVLLDPVLPLGLLGPALGRPYGVVLHGAEVAIPGRLPATRPLVVRVLRGADLVVAAGRYPEAEARRAAGTLPPVVSVPPGVDVERFAPIGADDRAARRSELGLGADAPVVLGVSRLVPRKGMDTLVKAAALLRPRLPGLQVLIAGTGRDRSRLEAMIRRRRAPVRLLGRVSDTDLPGVYGCADVFALPCRTRWGGLEQEGFGIVTLEAAAAGIPAVVGRSGGSDEAVADGSTGVVLDDPTDAAALGAAILKLLSAPEVARAHGAAARRRAEEEFSYDLLTARLAAALSEHAET